MLGQWTPIVGTGLAALGSLYNLLAADTNEEVQTVVMLPDRPQTPLYHCSDDGEAGVTRLHTPKRATSTEHLTTRHFEFRATSPTPGTSRRSTFPVASALPSERPDAPRARSQTVVVSTTADGNRRVVAGAFEWLGKKLGTPAPDRFDDTAFRSGPAADFPLIPAEEQRNPDLLHIMESYNPPRDSQGHATPNMGLSRQRSGTGSFADSSRSGLGIEGVSTEENELPGPSSSGTCQVEGLLGRKDTLEVPKPVLQRPISCNNRSSGSGSGTPSLANGEGSSPVMPRVPANNPGP